MRRGFGIACATVVVAGCSLFTDLGGLDDPEPGTTVVVVADGGNGGDGSVAADGGGAGDGATQDQVAPPKRYARTLKLTGDESGTTIHVGYTYCARLGGSVIGAAQTAGKMRVDLGDVRLAGASGEIPIVVDPLAAGSAEVCFKLERPIAPGATDTYELRYGDPNGQQPAVSRSSFFAFYDGFLGSTLGTKWLVWGTPVVANGRLEMKRGAEHGITTIATNDDVPEHASLEIKAEVTNPGSDYLPRDSGQTFWYWLGFQHTGDFDAYYPWEVFIARGKFIVRPEVQTASGACMNICMTTDQVQSQDKRIYRIDRHANGVRFSYDDGTAWDAPQAAGDLSIMIRSFLKESDLYVYWVRARALVFPEPSLEMTAEKSL